MNTSNRTDDFGVLKITHDGVETNTPSFGNSALARLDPDVYGQTDVRAVIVQLGGSDLGQSADPADRIIGGLQELAIRRQGDYDAAPER